MWPQVSAEALFWLGVVSVLSIFGSIGGVAWFIARMPADYFTHEKREPVRELYRWPLLRYLVVALKNVVGAVLVAFGLVLLFTPGQGALTILVGVMLLNFPGKYRLERWFITRRGVLDGLNWARARLGKGPVEDPADP
ncbi:PGPGW domain-containing protein [Thioalkalivibrio sp.]|uniref:PGPGW domain-containing protein n=1 Tax=Thioalkalivibrio sp. TaxID=2093813 RepID=UPI003974FF22